MQSDIYNKRINCESSHYLIYFLLFYNLTMLKSLIAPLQNILLQKGICPGCTATLSKAETREAINQKEEKVICKCGRIYIHDKEVNTYRRALESEI